VHNRDAPALNAPSASRNRGARAQHRRARPQNAAVALLNGSDGRKTGPDRVAEPEVLYPIAVPLHGGAACLTEIIEGKREGFLGGSAASALGF